MDLTHSSYEQASFLKKRSWFDWLYAVSLIIAAVAVYNHDGGNMVFFAKSILVGVTAILIVEGWYWRPIQLLVAVITVISLFAVNLYHGDLARSEQVFWLKYLFSSQSAIMWMSALFVLATGAYWFGLIARSTFAAKVGTSLTWSAVAMGLIGLLVRWYESYLMGHDIGHIPISSLYEAFVLFAIITSLVYLFYESHYRNRQLGAFVLTVISAAVAFLLWYGFTQHGAGIEPLVPALQSYWMKLHVPTSFIAYGAFTVAAVAGTAALLVNKGLLTDRLPPEEVLDDLMYKAIAIGFAFFTLAVALGSLWAAKAWGGYWSWDPKETWSLIVWLNYAAWLHMRMVKGLRGPVLAWWAVGGLLVTSFAFLGVNMFLSGLHSYGKL